MKKNKLNIIFLIFTIFYLSSCNKKNEVEIIRPVKIKEISSVNKDMEITFPSEISAAYETNLAFKIAGKIKNIKVDVGDYVKKDQELAELDERDYKINLEVYRQKYEAAKAAYKNVQLQFERAKKLYDAKAMAPKDYDNINSQAKIVLSTLKEAESGYENAKNIFSDTKIIAPYDGYIDKKYSEIASTINAGSPILKIISKDTSTLKINVSLQDIEKIKNSKKIFFVDDNTKKEYPLEIKNISQAPGSDGVSYPVILKFVDENNNNFLIGQSGEVKILIKDDIENNIHIPLSSIFEDNGTYVFLYKNGVVEKRKVDLGNLYGKNDIEILKGLHFGDKVIIAGVNKISENQKVKLLEE